MISCENRNFEAIEDPQSSEYIFDKDKILQTTLEYAAGVLQNNNPSAEFEEHFHNMRINHLSHMNNRKEVENEDEDLSEEDFREEIAALKSKGNVAYKEITEAGEGFQKKVLKVFQNNLAFRRNSNLLEYYNASPDI